MKTYYRSSGDKGVSVGEGSELLLIDSTVQACEFGVQVKDGSVARIQDCVFEDNLVALDAYQKELAVRRRWPRHGLG